MTTLTNERCVACRKDSPRVSDADIAELKPQIAAWNIVEHQGIPRLERTFRFKDFVQALDFTKRRYRFLRVISWLLRLAALITFVLVLRHPATNHESMARAQQLLVQHEHELAQDMDDAVMQRDVVADLGAVVSRLLVELEGFQVLAQYSG
jgi:hypothetical protein